MAKIFVSAGHGGRQPGACSGGYIEKTYTVTIANALADLLRAAGHTVTQNRTGDTDCSPEQAAALANKSGADFFIEIHLNAGGGTGCEVYYYSTDAKGCTIAGNIAASIAGLGYRNRGAKVGNGLCVINSTHMTAVLCECCFIDTAADMAALDIGKMAQAICVGILKTYPATVKPAPAPTPTPAPVPTPTPAAGYKEGDRVKLLPSASTYATGQKISPLVRNWTFYVRQIGNGKVLVSPLKVGPYTGWLRTADVTRV